MTANELLKLLARACEPLPNQIFPRLHIGKKYLNLDTQNGTKRNITPMDFTDPDSIPYEKAAKWVEAMRESATLSHQ